MKKLYPYIPVVGLVLAFPIFYSKDEEYPLGDAFISVTSCFVQIISITALILWYLP